MVSFHTTMFSFQEPLQPTEGRECICEAKSKGEKLNEILNIQNTKQWKVVKLQMNLVRSAGKVTRKRNSKTVW